MLQSISRCLFREEAEKKDADAEVKPAMDQTCVFEDLKEGTDKLKEDGEEDKVEVNAGKEDMGALGEEKEEMVVVGKDTALDKTKEMRVVGEENAVDISKSAQDKVEVEAGKEETGILDVEGEKLEEKTEHMDEVREEFDEVGKETAVDRTGDISESAQDKVEDLKVAGSMMLQVVKEKMEELKGKKEEKVEETKERVEEEAKGKALETLEELKVEKGEKKEKEEKVEES